MACDRRATTIALLRAGRSVEDFVDGVYDQVVYVMRYSKGGVNWRDAMGMESRKLRKIETALSRLVGRESKRNGSRATAEEE